MKAYAAKNLSDSLKSPGSRNDPRKFLRVVWMVVGVAVGAVACGTAKHEESESAHSGHGIGTALELNDGKKWVVDAPMMAHIREMERAVQAFEATPGSDHTVLANKIQDNLGKMVTKCTMEGKAHDELHKWLMPFLGVSAEYVKATEPQLQQQKLQEIKVALAEFNKHFE